MTKDRACLVSGLSRPKYDKWNTTVAQTENEGHVLQKWPPNSAVPCQTPSHRVNIKPYTNPHGILLISFRHGISCCHIIVFS